MISSCLLSSCFLDFFLISPFSLSVYSAGFPYVNVHVYFHSPCQQKGMTSIRSRWGSNFYSLSEIITISLVLISKYVSLYVNTLLVVVSTYCQRCKWSAIGDDHSFFLTISCFHVIIRFNYVCLLLLDSSDLISNSNGFNLILLLFQSRSMTIQKTFSEMTMTLQVCDGPFIY